MKSKPPAAKKSSAPKRVSATAGRKKVQFSIHASACAEVSVAGTFNEWAPLVLSTPAKGTEGEFSRTVYLPPGKYEYKFIVDGQWLLDPANKAVATNCFGTGNSVMMVS